MTKDKEKIMEITSSKVSLTLRLGNKEALRIVVDSETGEGGVEAMGGEDEVLDHLDMIDYLIKPLKNGDIFCSKGREKKKPSGIILPPEKKIVQ